MTLKSHCEACKCKVKDSILESELYNIILNAFLGLIHVVENIVNYLNLE